MDGYIGIHGHKIDCIIGVYPHEHTQPQTIYVDLKVKTNFSACCANDDLEQTVNYELLAQICTKMAQARHFKLLETFAAEVLKAVFAHMDVSWAWICVKKPGALPTADYGTVELELYR